LLLLAATPLPGADVRAGPSFKSSTGWIQPEDVPEAYAVAMTVVDAVNAGDVSALRKVVRTTDSWPEWKDREVKRIAWASERLARGIPKPFGAPMSLADMRNGDQLHLTRTIFDPLVPGVEARETITISLRFRTGEEMEDGRRDLETIVFVFDVLDRGPVLTELRMDDLPETGARTLDVQLPGAVALTEDDLLGTWELTRIRAMTLEDGKWRARAGPAKEIRRRIESQRLTFFSGGEGQAKGTMTDGTVVDEPLRWRLDDEGLLRVTVGDLRVRYVPTRVTGQVLILAEDPAWVDTAPVQELRWTRVVE